MYVSNIYFEVSIFIMFGVKCKHSNICVREKAYLITERLKDVTFLQALASGLTL